MAYLELTNTQRNAVEQQIFDERSSEDTLRVMMRQLRALKDEGADLTAFSDKVVKLVGKRYTPSDGVLYFDDNEVGY